MWDEPLVGGKSAQFIFIRHQKRCYFIKTAVRWPWK